jgi:pSer/pThr/pTyr-binding forkhead associated (FHA) protein
LPEFDRIPTTDEWIESLEALPIVGDLVLAADAGFEHFCTTYPYPWLLYAGDRNDLRRPGDPGSSDSSPAAASAQNAPRREMLAFAVQQTRSSEAHTVALGSDPSADVVIPDEMVAERHAFIREERGEFFLAPGPEAKIAPLKLNKAPVSAADPKGVPLRSGDVVALQDLELLFLSPKGMYELVQQID